MLDVSVVIPTLDEEDSIGICIEKIKKIFEGKIRGEIIVADNSVDRTAEIASSKGATVVTPDKRGYGYAYLYAFKYAKGKHIVIGDGDNTYDFSEIPKLLEPLEKGEADIVMGSRFKGEIKKGAMPWLHRYIGNPVLTGFLNLFLFGLLVLLLSYFHVNVGFTPGIHSMIAGSLAVIVGYQILCLGLFAGIYGRKHNLFEPGRLTEFIFERVSLERGATVGLAIFLGGFAYSLHLVMNWMSSGYMELPMSGQDMIGFTLLVIGLQTIFFSFFFSMIGGGKE